jgi:hypothetical protein
LGIMLAPRFTLRLILAITVVAAVFFWVGSFAVAGSSWAQALVVAVLAIPLTLVVHAFFFVAATILLRLPLFDRLATDSPFQVDPAAPVVPRAGPVAASSTPFAPPEGGDGAPPAT